MSKYVVFSLLVTWNYLMGVKFVVAESFTAEATDRAVDWIKSQQDPATLLWPKGERTAASLALLARYPYRFEEGVVKSEERKQELAMELAGVTIDFLTFINSAQLKASQGGKELSNPLEGLDDTTLLEVSAALRGHCVVDLADFQGFNLEQEFVRRLTESETDPLPSQHLYGGYVLALCNAKHGFSDQQVEKLGQIRRCTTCPFYVAEVSMNILATSCMTGNARAVKTKAPRLLKRMGQLRRIRAGLVRRLELSESSDGGFGDYVSTALAVQALVRTETRIVDQKLLDRSMYNLMSYQNEDGSFGGSIGMTALAIPAMTGQTAADLQEGIVCPETTTRKKQSNPLDSFHRLYIVLNDDVYSKQVFRFNLEVRHGTGFVQALTGFARKNRKTFQLSLRRSLGGPVIAKINGLEGLPGSRWKVYTTSPATGRILVTGSLRDFTILKDTQVELSLEFD